jgi:hypothetical protein
MAYYSTGLERPLLSRRPNATYLVYTIRIAIIIVITRLGYIKPPPKLELKKRLILGYIKPPPKLKLD